MNMGMLKMNSCTHINTVPSEPTKVWVEQMFASSALLTWSEPLENGGSDITGYKITFTSDRHGGYYVTGVVKMIKLVGLLANNAYNISISAFNTIGFGRASSQVFHTKSSGEPRGPKNRM